MDFIIELNQKIYPIEVKIGATANKKWLKNFHHLDNVGLSTERGVIISLTDKIVQISDNVSVINPGWI